jgi:neurofibromin 1
MRSILDDVLLHGQNATTLDAAHTLLRTLSSDRRYVRQLNLNTNVADVLEGKGFGGLWQSCSMGSMEDYQRDCFELTEKLIEVRRSSICLNVFRLRLTIYPAHYYLNKMI